MLNITPNIEKNQQIDLIVWGALIIVGTFLGFGFTFLVGVAMVAQGVLKFSVVPYVMNKLNIKL